MHFFKKWPQIVEADAPGNILWENFGKTKLESKLRIAVSWLAAIFTLWVSLIILASLKQVIT